MRERPHAPSLALWRVRMQAPIGVGNRQGKHVTDELFIGYYAHWREEIAIAETPTGSLRDRVAYDVAPGPKNAPGRVEVRLRLGPLMPGKLVRVDVEDE